jgi:cell wall-associated NlpC family hydrolase
MNAVSSCSMLLQGGINMVVGTSYTAEDEDILAAEAYYTGLESGLRQKIGKIETTHPGYDEYRYNLAEIGHDPFELMSYLTALYEDFTIAKARPALDTLFNRQYKLTVTETVETRYRTETRTGSYTTTDPDTGETETHYYTYEVEVPYSYYILNVTLTNNALSRIAAADLDTEKLELYAVYMETQGNKPYLFEGNIYAHPGPFTDYEIPPAALADANFAALIREAEKYLGYPYVWGGSNPSESFDCSGFVCWVLDHSGVYPIGRTNAQGIFNKTTPIAPSEAKPGDIIFFTGTYDSSGPVSHVGIYVGDNMMIHCASGGVQYARMDTKYWTQHFYAFGRLPL